MLPEVVVYIDFDETLISCVLIMRVRSNAAHSIVAVAFSEGKMHEIDAVGIAVQFLFDSVSHPEVGSGKTQTFLGDPFTLDYFGLKGDLLDIQVGAPVWQFFVLGRLHEIDSVYLILWFR